MTEWKEAEELLETEEEPLRHTVIVDKETESLRLDKLLGEAFPEFTRSALQKLIERGNVTKDGKPLAKIIRQKQASALNC